MIKYDLTKVLSNINLFQLKKLVKVPLVIPTLHVKAEKTAITTITDYGTFLESEEHFPKNSRSLAAFCFLSYFTRFCSGK